MPGLDVILCAKARCRNSLFNKSSNSSLSRRVVSCLNAFSTVGNGLALLVDGGDDGVDGGDDGGGGGVAVARLLCCGCVADSTTGLDLRDVAFRLSITSSAKLSDSVKP